MERVKTDQILFEKHRSFFHNEQIQNGIEEMIRMFDIKCNGEDDYFIARFNSGGDIYEFYPKNSESRVSVGKPVNGGGFIGVRTDDYVEVVTNRIGCRVYSAPKP